MSQADYLIVGAGLTGATIARLLVDAGKRVRVIERKTHPGGNCYDFRHESGILMGGHGPHYFRTSSERIWQFVRRFAEWVPFAAEVRARVGAALEAWPVTDEWLRRHCGANWTPAFKGVAENFEDMCLTRMPQLAYETFIKGYTQKQWGRPPKELSADLANRIEVRQGVDRRLKQATYQAVPKLGYTAFIRGLLAGIPVELGADYAPKVWRAAHTVYTGPIDEYFGHRLGKLRYRTQNRKTYWDKLSAAVQPVIQVNFPSIGDPHIRTVEWRHALPGSYRGSVVTYEYAGDAVRPDDYEYPVPDPANHERYGLYRALAAMESNLTFAGRLGTYRYLDMDQAIGAAMKLTATLLTGAPHDN